MSRFTKDDLWKVLATVGAVIAFLVGLHQYSEAQRWRRVEFLDEQIRLFDANASVAVAKTMLDFKEASVCLPNPQEPAASMCGSIPDTLLIRVFREATDTTVLNLEAQAIITAFDAFFSGLNRIGFLVEEGVLSQEASHPSVLYWITLLGTRIERAQDAELQRAICRYMAAYRYDGIRTLITRYVDRQIRTCDWNDLTVS